MLQFSFKLTKRKIKNGGKNYIIFPFLGIIGLGIAAIGCYAIFGGENYYCKICKKEKNTQTSPKHECSYCKINPICSSCAHTEDYTFLNETV